MCDECDTDTERSADEVGLGFVPRAGVQDVGQGGAENKGRVARGQGGLVARRRRGEAGVHRQQRES